MAKNNDLVFHTDSNNPSKVLDIECDESLKEGLKLVASKLLDNPTNTLYGLSINFMQSLIDANKGSILIESNKTEKETSFNDAIPLFTDYFASLNTQSSPKNQQDVIFHTNASNDQKVTRIECDKTFMDEIKEKATIISKNPSYELLNLTCQSLRISIENSNRSIFQKSGDNEKQISFEDSLPLFADYFASLNTKSSVVAKMGIEPNATSPDRIKQDNIRSIR